MAEINLSQLPPPDVIETLDYEAIVTRLHEKFKEAYPEHADFLESDPATELIELVADLSMILRQRVNDASREVMLASATGTNLDHLGALMGVQRLVLAEADPDAIPPTEAVYEADNDFRSRIQASLEGFSVAGPEGAYKSHARTIAGVKDVSVESPAPGDVDVYILSNDAKGIPSATLISRVDAVLNDEDVRPLTDNVTVRSCTTIDYQLIANLEIEEGPDSQVVKAEAYARIESYLNNQHRLGSTVSLSGIYAALHSSGVRKVTLSNPTADIEAPKSKAPYCTGITLTVDGS